MFHTLCSALISLPSRITQSTEVLHVVPSFWFHREVPDHFWQSLIDCSFSWFHLLFVQTFHTVIYIWHLKIPIWFLCRSKSNVYHVFFSSWWLNPFLIVNCGLIVVWFYPWKSWGLEVAIFSLGKHFILLLQGVGGCYTIISTLATLEGPRIYSWNFSFIFSKNYFPICWSIVNYCLSEKKGNKKTLHSS